MEMGLRGRRRGAYPLVVLAGGWSPAFYAFWEPLFAWASFSTCCILSAPLRRPEAGLAEVGATGLSHLHHPPPILVGVSLAMRGLAASALIKFVIAGTGLRVFIAAGALLVVPAVRRVV